MEVPIYHPSPVVIVLYSNMVTWWLSKHDKDHLIYKNFDLKFLIVDYIYLQATKRREEICG